MLQRRGDRTYPIAAAERGQRKFARRPALPRGHFRFKAAGIDRRSAERSRCTRVVSPENRFVVLPSIVGEVQPNPVVGRDSQPRSPHECQQGHTPLPSE
jgi:hypothetical protein